MKTIYDLILSKQSLTLLIVLGMASAAFAQESAMGTVSGVQNGSVYDYTITLDNTSSSVSIGSFWYSWTPNISPFFYLPSSPSTASGPTGWTGTPDGDSIQFVASGTSLAPLSSIQFHYVATFAPSQLTGLAGYSYVYHGGIETDAGGFLNVQTVTVPEPSSLSLMAVGVLGLVLAAGRKLAFV